MTMSHRQNRFKFTATQKAAIAKRLEEVRDSKFPSPRYISHQGYKVVVEVQICRLVQSPEERWRKAIAAADAILNTSDRAFVHAMIAALLPAKMDKQRKELLMSAERVVEMLPVDFERIEAYEKLAYEAQEIDSAAARRFIIKAAETALRVDSEDARSAQARVVDLAYRIDPDLAATLVSLTDKDDARRERRTEMQRQIRVRDKKREMLSDEPLASKLDLFSRREYADAAWLLLGSLKSGRIAPVRMDTALKSLEVTAGLSVRDGFPILAWIIENAVERYRTTAQARLVIGALFRQCVTAAEVARAVVKQSTTTARRAVTASLSAGGIDDVPVPAGDRAGALQLLRAWLDENLGSYLKVVDQYFGPDELDLLLTVAAVNPRCSVSILTSAKHLVDQKASKPWEEAYAAAWRRISDQEPPPVEIVVVGVGTQGKAPLHDRLWLTNSAGLSLGTSYNSLGRGQQSALKPMSAEASQRAEMIADRYLARLERVHLGDKIAYVSFTL